MSLSFTNSIAVQSRARALLPLSVGAGAYLFFLYVGNTLLQDSDSFWQIKIGQWILDHQALPYTDFYSFTRPGAPGSRHRGCRRCFSRCPTRTGNGPAP